jgi:RND family efflux transporter MFP subunit
MPGAYLREGDALFHVVNTDTLRLEVKIPEADIARLINPQGAWFTVDGYDKPFQIDFTRGDRLIAMGNVIDPQTRTLPLIFEFRNTENLLRVGMFARAHVIIGEPRESIAVPVSAVQEHNGMSVVYVQHHEDAFERRVVALGIRDGDFVEVRKGIHADENVVAIGAYLIQLAASGPQEAGHGHAH